MALRNSKVGGSWQRKVDGTAHNLERMPSEPPLPRDVAYHVARTIEELDLAETSRDPDARRVHEHIASIHLAAACRLTHSELLRVVADRVD